MLWDFFAPKIGVDAVDIARFRAARSQDAGQAFFLKTFTEIERTYCESFADNMPHYAGTFAAKEAASKALGTAQFPFVAIEIRRAKSGAPEVWKDGKRLRVNISITHTDSLAIAVATTRFFR